MAELVGWTGDRSGIWSGSPILGSTVSQKIQGDWDATLLARALALTVRPGQKPTLAAMGSKKVRDLSVASARVVAGAATAGSHFQTCFKFAELDAVRCKLLSLADRGTAAQCLHLIQG